VDANLAYRMSLDLLDKTILKNPWIPHTPEPKPAIFLTLPFDEGFYGGAAGAMKSDTLLMGGLQYIEHPDCHAILFRRTFADLALPDALMDRAHRWLKTTAARWVDRDRKYEFPSGSTLSFGYLETKMDKYRYQSAAFTYLGIDELTQFPEADATYLFSRMRKPEGCTVPIRVHGASNPGGIGHEWVKQRYVDPGHPSRPFIRALLSDNPWIDQKSYREQLAKLDPVTRRQLEEGDWSEPYPEGAYFCQQYKDAEEQGRITYVPWEPSLPVHTFWDLGTDKMRDSMTIWFMQALGLELRFINCYGVGGEGLPHMASYMQGLGYTYGEHYAPHDISVTEVGTGKTRLETALSLGIRFRQVPNIGFENGIQAARMMFHRCWFDKKNCATGLRALKNYQKEYDERGMCYKNHPIKDWTNDYADAFRMFGVGWHEKRDTKPKVVKKTYPIFQRRSA